MLRLRKLRLPIVTIEVRVLCVDAAEVESSADVDIDNQKEVKKRRGGCSECILRMQVYIWIASMTGALVANLNRSISVC